MPTPLCDNLPRSPLQHITLQDTDEMSVISATNNHVYILCCSYHIFNLLYILYTSYISIWNNVWTLQYDCRQYDTIALPLFTPPFSSERQELKNETTRSTKVFVKQNDTCGGWHVLSLPLPFTRTPQLHSHFIPFLFRLMNGIKVLLRAELELSEPERHPETHTPPPPLHPSLTIEAETMLDGGVERGRRRKRQRERLQGGPHYTH